MYPYLYELHFHTRYGSACGRSDETDYLPFYQAQGYRGIVVTDHFYHGNTAPSRDLPWDAYVARYCEGYYRMKDAAKDYGIDIFFGLEENFGGDEYLVLGLTPAWLTAHPELRNADRYTFLHLAREAGAFLIQAHPFRERDYIKRITLTPDFSDAVEVYNCGNDPMCSRRALEYARAYHLPMTGGSDIHCVPEDPHKAHLSGIASAVPFATVQELCEAIAAGQVQVIGAEALEPLPVHTRPTLPTVVLRTKADGGFAEPVPYQTEM